jgi:hypothetical protein
LPPEKLSVVLDFILYLLEREVMPDLSEALMAAETSLRKDWDRPEEDATWANF